MKMITGGVCAPRGYTANGIHCGIRHKQAKRDLSMILSKVPAVTAALYTKNLVKGAPILVNREHLKDNIARAIIMNSGNANTCNADGVAKASAMCDIAAEALGISPEDVVVASTGVIGQSLDIAPIRDGIGELVAGLSKEGGSRAAEGIMTTDTLKKEIALEFDLRGTTCRIGAMGKGSGMIHPDLATMLIFITTDAAISAPMLADAIATDTACSFNMLSVDGDTSTNDQVTIMANGLAGNPPITAPGEDYSIFMQALNTVTVALCRMIAGDGEGATKLLECRVRGAESLESARTAAKSVICSSLVKAAMFGEDANWGRVLCAIGYSGADVDVSRIDVDFSSKQGSVRVCEMGSAKAFSEEKAKEVLSSDEILIDVCLNAGQNEALAWGCDLTYDYVRINGDYRT